MASGMSRKTKGAPSLQIQKGEESNRTFALRMVSKLLKCVYNKQNGGKAVWLNVTFKIQEFPSIEECIF